MNPTIEQQNIIQYARSGNPLTVIARAGTGKTTTIISASDPEDIILAFNKKIAEEISNKGRNGITWHALILRELKINGAKFRLDSYAEIPYDIVEDIKRNNPEDGISMVKELASIVSILKESIVSYDYDAEKFVVNEEFLDEVLSEYPLLYNDRAVVLNVLRDSVESLSPNRKKISFSDLLLLGLTLPEGNFPNKVWVDEAQDTNALQLKLAKHLFPKGMINFVGDPAQAIYHFRGAGSKSMELIEELFPENKIFSLTVSFRCAHVIISEAQKIVPDIHSLPNAVPGNISEIYTIPQELNAGQALLCRNNKPLIIALSDYLKRGILCNYKDKGFLREVSDMQRKISKNGMEREVKKASNLKPDARKKKELLIDCSTIIESGLLREALSITSDNFPVLSTVHSAKGLEWNHVFLIDFPTDSEDYTEIERSQERNLKYVGITRAKSHLTYIIGV